MSQQFWVGQGIWVFMGPTWEPASVSRVYPDGIDLDVSGRRVSVHQSVYARDLRLHRPERTGRDAR